MHVKISNITFEVENTPAGTDELFTRADEALRDFQVYFSHIRVDGEESGNSDPRQFLLDRLEKAQDVEIDFLIAEEYLQKILSICDNFLETALPRMDEMAAELYGRPDEETWVRFNTIMEGLRSLVDIINSIVADPQFKGRVQEFHDIGQKAGGNLINLLDAAQRNDTTLVADIMKFELVPFAESLNRAIAKLTAGYRDDSH